MFFGAPPYNTLIGGEGVTTNTAAALETLLGLSPGDVTYFKLSGNDILARINVKYDIPASAFQLNTDITSYVDYEGRVDTIGTQAFEDTTSLGNNVSFPACRTVWGYAFRRSAIYGDLVWPELVSVNISAFANATNSFTFTAPVLTSFGGNYIFQNSGITKFTASEDWSASIASYTFDGCASLTECNVIQYASTFGTYCFLNAGLAGELENNVAEAMGTGAFRNTLITKFKSTTIRNVGSSVFWGCVNMVIVDLDADMPCVKEIGSNCYRSAGVQSFTASNLIEINNNAFYDTDLNYCHIPNVVRLGSTTANNNIFAFTPNEVGSIINVHKHLATNNGGGPDGDLTISFLSNWTVNYETEDYNLEIDGVGGTILNAADAESLLGLSAGDCLAFSTDGTDIQLLVGQWFVLPSSAFLSDTDITAFRDLVGVCAEFSANCFYGAINCTEILAPYLVELGSSSLKNTGCTELSFPYCKMTGTGTFADNANLTDLDIRRCYKLGTTSGYNNVFEDMATGVNIDADQVLETNNEGGRDGDIAYAEDTLSANITYH